MRSELFFKRGAENGHHRGMTIAEVAKNMKCTEELITKYWPKGERVSSADKDAALEDKRENKKKKKKKK